MGRRRSLSPTDPFLQVQPDSPIWQPFTVVRPRAGKAGANTIPTRAGGGISARLDPQRGSKFRGNVAAQGGIYLLEQQRPFAADLTAPHQRTISPTVSAASLADRQRVSASIATTSALRKSDSIRRALARFAQQNHCLHAALLETSRRNRRRRSSHRR